LAQFFTEGIGHNGRKSHKAAPLAETFQVQAKFQLPSYPFQPLPPPNGPAPFRFDLSQLLTANDFQAIESAGVLVCHSVGDTGDYRGQQQDFVAAMMTADSENSPADKIPAFLYHLGDVIYFAGDIDRYGANFYETYKNYPAFIVAIPGNHDCQPDDPQDGPVNPAKVPLDGWVQNFMAPTPTAQGSPKTGASRTQMDLPNVYWTFTTPMATFIGLFSNVGETEAEIHQDQIDWFTGELTAADPNLPLIVTIHHPPFSGDSEHSGSSVAYKVLFDAFASTNRYPNLILSGHVHNYQRFTHIVPGAPGSHEIPLVVAGAGGYTNLGKLHKIKGAYPTAPLTISNNLTLEQYDHSNFGFLRLQISKTEILGTYYSAPYVAGGDPNAQAVESFIIDVANFSVSTGAQGQEEKHQPKR
jgi:acid phosphatase type 7